MSKNRNRLVFETLSQELFCLCRKYCFLSPGIYQKKLVAVMLYRFTKTYVKIMVMIVTVGSPTHDMKLIKNIPRNRCLLALRDEAFGVLEMVCNVPGPEELVFSLVWARFPEGS